MEATVLVNNSFCNKGQSFCFSALDLTRVHLTDQVPLYLASLPGAHVRDGHGHHGINVFYGQAAAAGRLFFYAFWPSTTQPPAWRKTCTAMLGFTGTFGD